MVITSGVYVNFDGNNCHLYLNLERGQSMGKLDIAYQTVKSATHWYDGLWLSHQFYIIYVLAQCLESALMQDSI